MARRYGFYLRVVKTIFYSFATLICKILFPPLKDKIHIFKPTQLYFYYINSMEKTVNDVIDIFTSEDMENMSLVKTLASILIN